VSGEITLEELHDRVVTPERKVDSFFCPVI